MSRERSRRLSDAELARNKALFGDEDGVRTDSAPRELPLLHLDPEKAQAIATEVEEAVGWGHRVSVSIGQRDSYDPSGVVTARILLADGTVSFHGTGADAAEALSVLTDPQLRVAGDRLPSGVHPNSGGLHRVPRARIFPSTGLDLALQTHALVVGVSTESGSITATLHAPKGIPARGSGANFPDALRSAIRDIR